MAFFILLSTTNISAQTQVENIKPENLFDFWIGNWDLTWESSSGDGIGENVIIKILENKVIQENFKVLNDPNIQGFIGKSWSVYNQNNGIWYQTWVDNQGAYLDFIGEIDGENRIFKRSITKADGSVILQRMVFSNISENSFIWDWENSTDGGKTWNLQWRINYKRK